jgi:hypothetical protein
VCGFLTGNTAAAQDAISGAAVMQHLTGTWRAPEERLPRSSSLDQQVFGAGAADVRTVALVISPSGDADLQVRRSVVGSKGKVFAPSITEVKMRIGEPVSRQLGQLRPTVTVTSAEERFLDGDHERWQRDGMRVSISFLDLTSREINLQVETPDGRGAFGATLTGATSARTGR